MKSYTYMGTADDVVRRYPWKHGWNIDSLNNQLIHSVIYDQNLVISDGYIIANPELFGSLKNLSKSLLGNVLLSGSATLFCRGKPQNLVGGLQKSAEKIHTHKAALSGKGGKDLIRQLETLQTYVNKSPIQWPKDKNTGAIFASFLNELNYNDNLNVSLSSGRLKDDFIQVYKQFESDMDENFKEARQHWEQLCWRILGNMDITKFDPFGKELTRMECYERVRSLMNVANEAYHIAYTSALHWSLRSLDSSSLPETAPLTAFCPAYLNIFQSEFLQEAEDIQFEKLGNLLINVDLLRFGRDANYSWIMSLVLDDELVEIRTSYLDHLERYMQRECEYQDALKAAKEYRSGLARLVADKVPTYSDVAESLFNFFGGSQVLSAIQGVESLLEKANIRFPVNLDPVKAVRRIVESGEIERELKKLGLESSRYGTTNNLARDLGLVNVCLNPVEVKRILEPIKPYNPNV